MPNPVREPRPTRGAARREALLDATVRLLAREGARAVTHRAVAEEAGTTHGSARYYFGTRDRLLDEALRRLAARQIVEVQNRLSPTPDAPPHAHAARLAHYLAGAVDDDRDACIARYELFLEVARRPHLRPALDAWGDAQRRAFAVELAAAGADDPEGDAAHLLTLLNGLILEQLAAPEPDFEHTRLRPAIERYLTGPGSGGAM
ncbi:MULTISPECIES: TetR family transcriptional regulator [unclassified Streptomyces]|uniref:TetR/AcrR family transcriptional regulator n=1 Tax=unclassified Streptomyces TaxID=2593676 RepID=UPI0033329F5A